MKKKQRPPWRKERFPGNRFQRAAHHTFHLLLLLLRHRLSGRFLLPRPILGRVCIIRDSVLVFARTPQISHRHNSLLCPPRMPSRDCRGVESVSRHCVQPRHSRDSAVPRRKNKAVSDWPHMDKYHLVVYGCLTSTSRALGLFFTSRQRP